MFQLLFTCKTLFTVFISVCQSQPLARMDMDMDNFSSFNAMPGKVPKGENNDNTYIPTRLDYPGVSLIWH